MGCCLLYGQIPSQLNLTLFSEGLGSRETSRLSIICRVELGSGGSMVAVNQTSWELIRFSLKFDFTCSI